VPSKYTPESLLPALRLFAEARNQALAAGFTDNGGAIHSAERILDILGMRLCYPHLHHINSIKRDPNAKRSEAAELARRAGETVDIEHVMPQRAFARAVIAEIDRGATDDEIVAYVRGSYRLVLLTPAETKHVNKINRSKLTPDRIKEARITLFGSPPPGGSTRQ
jgi:hypothetical protein